MSIQAPEPDFGQTKCPDCDIVLKPHDCRHSFTSQYMMRGGSVTALQQILGHASLTMTMKYAHLSPGHLRDEMLRTERQNESSFSENRAQARAHEGVTAS